MLHEVAFQAPPAHDEVHVDAGEDLRIRGRAIRGDLDVAAGHLLAALLEDHYDVVGGATARSDEYHLHGPGCQVPPATVRRPVHGDEVVAAGLGDKCHALASPAHGALHIGLFGHFFSCK